MFAEEDELERRMRFSDGEDAWSRKRRILNEAMEQLPGDIYTKIRQEMRESYRNGESSYIVNVVHFFEYDDLAPPGYDYLHRSYRGLWLSSIDRKSLANNLTPKIAKLLRKDGHKARVSLTNWSIITVKF